ncbi:uncharacterized protein LOC125674584 [Ostrea edulis]|uniref:uncharacterized protein LOC125674584 n=1 Tax=Ostrea edulis TaxID=37623 RepID=UPI0024AF829F|nr:uncharacterized protein LOC125674584 [Ostrea edulis]
MNGYCAAYDTDEQRLVNYIDEDCTEFEENACPTRYLSTDIFKYTGCYNLIESRSRLDVRCRSSDNSDILSSLSPVHVILSIIIGILATLLAIQSVFTYKLRRKYQHAGENKNVNNNKNPTDPEIPVDEDSSHYHEEYIDESTGKTLWLRYPRTKTIVKYIYKNDKKHYDYGEILPIHEKEPEHERKLDQTV